MIRWIFVLPGIVLVTLQRIASSEIGGP